VQAVAGVVGAHGVCWGRWSSGVLRTQLPEVELLLDVELLDVDVELLLVEVELLLDVDEDTLPPEPPAELLDVDEDRPPPAPPAEPLDVDEDAPPGPPAVLLDVVPLDALRTVPPQRAAPINASEANPASCHQALFIAERYRNG
jgi:hypothetical protein